MSRFKETSLYKEQKATKPKIEDVINDIITDNEIKKSALDFVAYLRANKMSPVWSVANTWMASCKGNTICGIQLDWSYQRKADWVVYPYIYQYHTNEYNEIVVSEGLHNTVWGELKYCNGCPPKTGKPRAKNRPCIGGKDVTVFGKDFKGVCANFSHVKMLWFYDPNEVEVKIIKKLIELEKQARNNECENERNNK